MTGKELKLADDTFKLQHLLDCHLLEHRDDIEELTTSALKEEQIETKLAALSADWAEQTLTFADYKTRGEVILKVCAARVSGIWQQDTDRFSAHALESPGC